jgi:hypothetical protein
MYIIVQYIINYFLISFQRSKLLHVNITLITNLVEEPGKAQAATSVK